MTRRAYGWAWLCDFGLCSWVEPEKEVLTSCRKPSPEAIAVRVELVPTLKRHRDFVQRKQTQD